MESYQVNSEITVPESAIEFRFSRSSGKGGQNVNKVSTKVELVADIALFECSDKMKNQLHVKLAPRLDANGKLHLVSQESRSQWQNKKIAVKKLIELIEEASQLEKERIPTKHTAASKNKRVQKKKKIGEIKSLRRRKFNELE